MDTSEDLSLLFMSGGFYFLAPIFCVQRIAYMADEADNIDTIYLSEEGKRQEVSGYRIYLEADGKTAAVCADRALGITDMNEVKVFPLEAPVIHKGNRYIRAAVPMQYERQNIMAYVLEPAHLLESKGLWTI